jgi:hypothetical protein
MLVWGHRLAEAAGGEGGHGDIGTGEQQQEQRDAGGEGFDGPQLRVLRLGDPANLDGDQPSEQHQPDHQHRDGEPTGRVVQGRPASAPALAPPGRWA